MSRIDKLSIKDMLEHPVHSSQAQGKSDDEMFNLVTIDEKESEHIAAEPYSYWRSVFRVFIHKPSAVIALSALIVLLLAIFLVPLFAPQEWLVSSMPAANQHPNATHIWGTDAIGRDLFYIVWIGAKKSLFLALISAGLNVLIGTIVGLIWGFFRKLDPFFVELYNLVTNIPSLLVYMLLAFVLLQSFKTMSAEVRLIIALTLTGWLGLARFVRNQVLIINNREYNIASKTLGTPSYRIMFRNLLPYILAIIITEASLFIPGMISSEVTLSFFGVGLDSQAIALGAILDLGRQFFTLYPEQLLAPALVLAFIIFTFFLLGLALSDALDPKKHR